MATQAGTININGTERPVIQHPDGRLWAGDSVSLQHPFGVEGRTWNAMTMEILQERIDRTFKRA